MKSKNRAQHQHKPGDKRIETLLAQADKEFLAGNLSLAEDYLGQALQIEPTNSQILNAFGNLLLRSGKAEEAGKIFARAVKAAPQDVAGYNNLCVVCIMLGKIEDAEFVIEKSLALDPANPETLQLLEHLKAQASTPPASPAPALAPSQVSSENDQKLKFFLGNYAERAQIWNELGSEHIVQQLSIGTSLEQVSVISKPKAEVQLVDGLAVPPRLLRMGYYMDDTEGFLRSGKKSYESLCGLLESAHVALLPGDSMLDWGCATGRSLRYFAPLAENCNVWGSDVDAPAIEWCTQYLNPPFKFLTATGLPYLPFEQNTFKFIYGLSVFTHITSMRDMWLLELARILRKDGVAIMTVHNEHSWETFRKEGMPSWVPQDLRLLPEIPEWGLDLRGDFWYQSYTFFHSNYIKKVWGQYFDILDIVPRAEGYQTAVVMKKK
jgi:SAM-dependent methyltransferase